MKYLKAILSLSIVVWVVFLDKKEFFIYNEVYFFCAIIGISVGIFSFVKFKIKLGKFQSLVLLLLVFVNVRLYTPYLVSFAEVETLNVEFMILKTDQLHEHGQMYELNHIVVKTGDLKGMKFSFLSYKKNCIAGTTFGGEVHECLIGLYKLGKIAECD